MKRSLIYQLVDAERDRQHEQWGYRHEWGQGDCSSPHVPTIVKATVLSEETGEVAKAVLEQNPTAIRSELVQVAAVAVAWLESMPAQIEGQTTLL